MTIALAMVPSPGRSRRGIHKRRTKALTAKVADPIVSGVRSVRPSAKTVQGPLPSSATTRSASPVPNNHSPMIKMIAVLGRAFHRDGERHGVTGMECDVRSHVGNQFLRGECAFTTDRFP